MSSYIRELRRYDDAVMALRYAWVDAMARAIDQEITQIMGIPVRTMPGLSEDEMVFISGRPLPRFDRAFMIKEIVIGTGERRAL